MFINGKYFFKNNFVFYIFIFLQRTKKKVVRLALLINLNKSQNLVLIKKTRASSTIHKL